MKDNSPIQCHLVSETSLALSCVGAGDCCTECCMCTVNHLCAWSRWMSLSIHLQSTKTRSDQAWSCDVWRDEKLCVCSSGCSGAEREPESCGLKRSWNKAQCVCFGKKKKLKIKNSPFTNAAFSLFFFFKLWGSNSESFVLYGWALKFEVATGKTHDSGTFRVGCVNYQGTSSSVIIPNGFICFTFANLLRSCHRCCHFSLNRSC